MKYFKLIVLSICLPLLTMAQPTKVTLEDIWINGKFQQKYVWGMRSLADGENYSKITNDNGNQVIKQYSYEDENQTAIIFNSRDAGAEFAFSDYEFSNDEQKILLATATEGIYRHSSKSHYHVWDRAAKKMIKLSDGSKQMYPTFSPDGSKVAYVQDNNLFVKDLQTGKTNQATTDGKWNNIINGASDWVYEEELVLTRAYEWAPDGKHIAFIRFDEREVPMFNMTMYNGLYLDNYAFKYPKAGDKNAIASLHLLDVKKNQVSDLKINKNEFYIPRIQWTQDPNQLSVQVLNRHQNELDLMLFDIKKGMSTTLLKETNPYYIDITDDLTFMEDGDHFIWTSERDGYNHIYLYTMNGDLVNQVTKGEWDVTSYLGYDEKKKVIYYQSAEQSPMERHIYSIKTDGEKQKLITPLTGSNSVQFTNQFKNYVLTHSSVDMPTSIAVYKNNGKLVRTLEDNAEMKEIAKKHEFVDKEFITIPGANGTDLNAFIMKPKKFKANKEYPVLMFVYGGPGSQTVRNTYIGRNDVWFQHLTQLGYIVVSVDNRGTGARGQEFKKTTYLNLGKVEVDDQMAAAKFLANQKYIDANRIGIFGWSYGGYMSSLCMMRGAHLFKMGIAVAPVTNWKFYDTIYTERYMRTPKENKGYDNNAPITHVDKLKGKYLLVHGTADDNVHFQNATELVEALVEADKEFDLMVYPDKAHGIGGRKTRLHLYKKMTKYIQENL